MVRTKGILFDKDGTFLDFDSLWQDTAKKFSQKIYEIAPKESKRICESIGIREGRIVPNSPLSSGTYQQIADVMRMFSSFASFTQEKLYEEVEGFFYQYLINHIDDTRLIGNVQELFARLHPQIVIGIATSDSYRSTEKILVHFGLEKFVVFIASGDNVPAKPTPELLDTICDRYQFLRQNVMVIGDSTVDVILGV